MEITKEQFEDRLNHKDNPLRLDKDKINYEVIKVSKASRKIGTNGIGKRGPEVPLALKVVIGTIAQNSPAKKVAEVFKVSKHSVDNYRNGNIGDKPSAELKSKIKTIKDSVLERATDIVAKSLGLISDDKLEDMNVKELVGVAVGVSTVHERMSDKTMINAPGSLIVYSPKTLEKEDYPVTVVDR